MKKRKIRAACVVVFAFILVLTILVPGNVQASGLVNFEQNGGNQYSSYALENYDLDFYVDMSWTWLPWNWLDGAGRSVMHGLYSLTNILWGFSRWISYGTGEIVTEAYRFDIVNELADSIGANMQRLAGVSPSGFSAEGFYSGFLMLIIVTLGVYVAYVGLYKREMSKALSAVVSTVVIFIFGAAFIAYAPEMVRNLNEFSTDVSTGALQIGTGLVIPGAETGEGDSVDRIRDQLFNVQIYQPWLILQFGTADIDMIGAERVNNLLSVSPDTDYGQAREAVAKTEIETYGNLWLSTTKVGTRFAEVLFIFFVNLLISIFVILLCGMMIITQLLFIVYVMFLAVAFVLAMFPTFGGMLKKALLKVFNIIMLRAGYVLLITITFMISSMIYGVADNHSFVTIGFLQIIVYVAVFLNKNEILEFMSLKSDRGVTMLGGAGAALAYSRMRRMGMRHEHRVERKRRRRENKWNERIDDLKDRAWDGIVENHEQKKSRKASAYMREMAAQRSWKTAQMRQNLDYSAADRTPDVQSADFYEKRSQKDASSGQIYDKYLNRMHGRDLGRADKPHHEAAYRAADQTPNVTASEFKNPAKEESAKKYRRPELWESRMKSNAVREQYQGNVYKPRETGTHQGEAATEKGVTASGMTKKYHVANRTDTPRLERVNRGDMAERISDRGNSSARSSEVEGTRVRTSGRGTSGENYELVDSASVRKQEESNMGTKIKESRNYKRTNNNWRTGSSGNLKPRENNGNNAKQWNRGKGNRRGQ